MTQHPNIHKISFTGSIPTGKKIMAACAATMKRVTLELGGNDACIVCPDISDIGAVAKEIVLGAFLNTGATCVASKRVYIHKDIYAPMLDAFREQVNQLSVGGANALIGPVQNKMQYQRVRDLVQEARADNYEIVAEGQISLEAEQKKKGYFIAPIIVSNAPSDSRLVREEQFVSITFSPMR
jgi:acyl-CoA reductase-like NAD-dependent aldehyde dehydrogenase